MKKYWWIVSVLIHTTGWDGSPDGDNYPVKKQKIFKKYDVQNKETYNFFHEQILNFMRENYIEKGCSINFVWCLGYEKEEVEKATELEKYLKEQLK